MTENKVSLRFLLEHGAFMQITVPEPEARQIIQGWIAGALKQIIGNADLTVGGWATRVSAIIGIHLVTNEGVQGIPQNLLQHPGNLFSPWTGNSGI